MLCAGFIVSVVTLSRAFTDANVVWVAEKKECSWSRPMHPSVFHSHICFRLCDKRSRFNDEQKKRKEMNGKERIGQHEKNGDET